MPKKFAITQLREWLQQFEQGKSVDSIARAAHCDVRTVKKGIEQARRERDAATARSELIREALRKHQGGLLSMIEEILSNLTVSYADSAILDWKREEIQEGKAPADVRLGPEHKAEWGLLQEHLKGDPLWKALPQRQKALAAFLNAKQAFQRKTVTLLEAKTGCPLVGNKGAIRPPFAFMYTAGPLVFDVAMRQALAIPDRRNLEEEVLTDTGRGEVTYLSGTTLAKVPGQEEAYKRNMLAALKELPESPEAIEVAKTYKELKESTARARKAVEEVSLLGMVPGWCRICRRLGI